MSPANDFANAFPKHVDFKRGGLLTGIIGILMMPWQLLANPTRYLDSWLGGYGAALGSVAGVLIVDYWIVRRTSSISIAVHDRRRVSLSRRLARACGDRDVDRLRRRAVRRVLAADAPAL